jgi:hypothetical protein
MLRFFTAPRLALNPNSIFEIGSSIVFHKSVQKTWLRHRAIFLTPCPKMLNVARKRLSAGVIVIKIILETQQ